jgi:hypothetical protein
VPALFSLLGAQPILGRVFSPEEDQNGRTVAILSYGFWQREFAGAPGIVSRYVTLNRKIYTVIGVLPATLVFPLPGMGQGDAAMQPISLFPSLSLPRNRRMRETILTTAWPVA